MSTNEEGHVELEDYRVMVFTSSGEYFAIPLKRVKEVIGRPEITELSFTPGFLKGVTNLRGQVITVIDFQEKLRGNEDTEASCTIIIDLDDVSVGLIVNEVDYVIDVNEMPISEAPEVEGMKSKQHNLLLGIVKNNEDLIKLVDVDKFVDLDGIKVVAHSLKVA